MALTAKSFTSPYGGLIPTSSNYLGTYDFTHQFMPHYHSELLKIYSQESLTGFLEYYASTEGFNADTHYWGEEGRRHIKYNSAKYTGGSGTGTVTVNDDTSNGLGIRVNEMVALYDQTPGGGYNLARVTAVNYDASPPTFDIKMYSDTTNIDDTGSNNLVVFTAGSEFAKGTDGMTRALERDFNIYNISPIIQKELFRQSGSDLTNIGWLYDPEYGNEYWYLNEMEEFRKRAFDKLELSMILAEEADSSQADNGHKGTEGFFSALRNRGNVFQGQLTTKTDFENIIKRMDEANGERYMAAYVNRAQEFAFNDLMSGLNSHWDDGANYGVFENGKDTALELGFKGLSIGTYEFYVQPWKVLNNNTVFGGDNIADADKIHGAMIPLGDTDVTYKNQGMAQDSVASVPYLTLMFKEGNGYSRKLEEFPLGSVMLGNPTTDTDELQIHLRTERMLRTAGAQKFVLIEGTA